jgi:hypothetical protein
MADPALLLAEQAAGARIAASVLLAAYLATAAILLPREMSFLAGVPQPQRGKFIAMDVVIQLCVLAVLLPSIVLERLNLVALIVVVAGFTVLWIVAAINARSRYIYTNKILKDSMQETRKQLERLVEEKRAEDGQRD